MTAPMVLDGAMDGAAFLAYVALRLLPPRAKQHPRKLRQQDRSRRTF
jgi:hypothetical protein